MCSNYSDFIARIDRPQTLFYLDPPYFGCESDYGKALFERADFERMAEQLRGIKGDFIKSINDVPAIRETFDGFNMAEVSTTYTVGTKTPRAGGNAELLISNFELGIVDV